ncbi:MAG: CHAT domain-containing protein [Hyalangium sp.]|uniref:CHAT domain-containing protein n=1 Tax=Hyalangium sp. TaxID=2028555 RepID=UPI00389A45B2
MTEAGEIENPRPLIERLDQLGAVLISKALSNLVVAILKHARVEEETPFVEPAGVTTWKLLCDRVLDITRRVGGHRSATPAAIEMALSGESAPVLSRDLLVMVAARISELDLLSRWVACALVLRWIEGSEFEVPWWGIFAYAAVRTLYDLGRVEFFPVRLRLLDALIDKNLPAISRVDLLLWRANTRVMLAGSDAAQHELGLQDLREAEALSQRNGNVEEEVRAACARAHAEALGVHGAADQKNWLLEQAANRLTSLLARVPGERTALPLYEVLAEIESQRAEHGTASAGDRALRYARQAAVAGDSNPRHATSNKARLAELLLLYGKEEDRAEAIRLARQALQELPADAGEMHASMPHAVLGTALFKSGAVADAIGHLEQALSLQIRQAVAPARILTRISLGRAYLAQNQRADARHQLERAEEEARAVDDHAGLYDAVQLISGLDREEGNDDMADIRLQDAERIVAGTFRQPLLALERLRPRHYGAALSEELLALMRRYLEGKLPRSAEADEMLAQIVANHADEFPADLQGRFLMDDARVSGDPVIRAKLLDSKGHTEEALSLLRQVLAEGGDPRVQLNAAATLIVLLPEEAHEERLQACELVEDLIGDSEEYAAARNDLAEGLRLCARNDQGLLARARRHADMAAKQFQHDAKALEINTRVRANIRADQLARSAMQSTSAVIELAEWLERGLKLPAKELAARREHAAMILLHPGPLAHPQALEVAGRLLDRVPESEEARRLKQRLQWIQSKLQEQATDQVPPEGESPQAPSVQGPFDEAPAWALALLQGRGSKLDRAFSAEDHETIFQVLTARPDRADALLEWVLEQDALGDSEGQDLIANIAAMAPRGRMTPDLLQTVEEITTRKGSFPMLRLRVLLHSQSLNWGDGTPYARSADELIAVARTPEERVEARFLKGIERMNALQRHRRPDEKRQELAESARRYLREALDEARGLQLPEGRLFSLLVSAGNSFRIGRAPDLEQALALYREAEALGAPNKQGAAKLWKVQANALLARKAPGDAKRALILLEQSLEVRRGGYLRVETLVAAAEAEMAQLDRDEQVRLSRALSRIDEAVIHAEAPHRHDLVKAQIYYLGRLVHLSPHDEAAQRRLEALHSQFPELAKAIDRAKHGWTGPVPPDMVELISELALHPAITALVEAKRSLLPRRLSMGQEGAEAALDDDFPADLGEDSEQHQSVLSPQDLRAHVDQLVSAAGPEALPGAAVGRASVLAQLTEQGVVSAEEVRRLAEEAEQHVRRMPDSVARCYLLLEVARLWAPESHFNHPVRDFRRAAALAREVLEACPPGSALARDALHSLARATRYRKDGDTRTHRREAERLYEQAAREYESVGMKDVAARVRVHLSELRQELHPGGTESPLREGLSAAREALAATGSGARRVDAQATLAYFLTSLGADLQTPEGNAMLAEAKSLYEHLDWTQLVSGARASAENFQTICFAELARRAGRRGVAIEIWRKRLAQVDRASRPDEWGYTVHNLADMLLRAPTAAQLEEGLDLAEKALQVRTLEHNARHHWETCWLIGRTVVGLLEQWIDDRPWPFSFSPQTLWKRGLTALQGAGQAARRLDGGDRLRQVAVQLFGLAMSSSSREEYEQTAELAWKDLDEARPYMLLDEEAGAEEARWGADITAGLASELSEEGIVGVSDGRLAFLLSGEKAERVLKWMARTLGAAQRRLAGRTAQPDTVSRETWVEWLSVIQAGDARDIARVLDRIRQSENSFLRGEPDLTQTWNWLQTRPGSVAVAVLETPMGLLAAILEHSGRRTVHIAALEVEAPPLDEPSVAAGLDASGGSAAYGALLSWAKECVTLPLQRQFSQPPTQILWVPTGVLRMLAPADVWPSSPVTCAVRLDLETRAHPARPRRTLVAVADPGLGCDEAQEIPDAIPAGVRLARLAEQVGPVRVRMSQGRAFGESLEGECPGLERGPASPDDVLRELPEVDVALFLCHGEVSSPHEARLLLLDESGKIAALDMERMAQDPRRLAGMLVVLLSCQTGRVGDWLHRAAGLSGALLACGARSVVAPLWPVRTGPAVAVGEAVLSALSTHADLSVALHQLRAPERGSVLGGPMGAAQREFEQSWSLKAFVHWTA